jgi:hypothetical protein
VLAKAVPATSSPTSDSEHQKKVQDYESAIAVTLQKVKLQEQTIKLAEEKKAAIETQTKNLDMIKLPPITWPATTKRSLSQDQKSEII